ncbi:MAG: hypothetical protein WB816_11980 [Methylocystis sp.]
MPTANPHYHHKSACAFRSETGRVHEVSASLRDYPDHVLKAVEDAIWSRIERDARITLEAVRLERARRAALTRH